MGRIFCVVEDYDTILKCRRPNGTSRTWGLSEFKDMCISLIVDRNNRFNSHKRVVTVPPFIGEHNELKLDTPPPGVSVDNNIQAQVKECGNFWYVSKENIKTKKFLYVIHLYGSEYFDQHRTVGLKVIDEEILEKIRNNQGHIVIFFVNEPEPWVGPKGGTEPTFIDKWRKDANLPPYSVSYFTGNYKLIQDKDYLAKFKINIKPFTAFYYTFAYYTLTSSGKTFEYNPIDTKNIFLSYMRLPRKHRWLIYAELIKRGIDDRGLISFGLNQGNSGVDNQELENIIDKDILNEIRSRGEQYISDPTLQYNLADSPFHEYDYSNTFLSIVNETSYTNTTIFLSEKIWKPIIAGQPFIVNGNPGIIKVLKDLGYRTFDKWWDESYDNEPDLIKRVGLLGDILEKLSKKTVDELKNIRKEMTEVLEHNQNLIYNIINTKITAKGDTGDWREEIIKIYDSLKRPE